MLVPHSNPGSRRHLGAALSAGVLIALIFVTFSWSRLFLTGRIPDDIGAIIRGVLTGWILATVAFVPFLLAVLIVVADWSRRAIVGSAGLVYLVDLLLTVGQTMLTDFSAGLKLIILAVPLTKVVTLLAIATAVGCLSRRIQTACLGRRVSSTAPALG